MSAAEALERVNNKTATEAISPVQDGVGYWMIDVNGEMVKVGEVIFFHNARGGLPTVAFARSVLGLGPDPELHGRDVDPDLPFVHFYFDQITKLSGLRSDLNAKDVLAKRPEVEKFAEAKGLFATILAKLEV